MSMLRRVVPAAVVLAAALAAPASANHTPCAGMGGLLLTGIGPTNATLCVYVGANGVAFGTDVIHECDSTCTVGGVRFVYTGGSADACVAIIYEGTWIVDNRCV